MTLLDAFTSIRKTAADATDQYRTLRRKREGLRRERDALLTRPAVAADLKAVFTRYVNDQRAVYLRNLETHLRPLITRSELLTQPTWHKGFLTVVGVAAGTGAEVVSIKDADQALCALFGESLVAAIGKAIDDLPLPEGGLTLVERERQIGKLDTRIAEFDRQMDEIAAAANQAGVVLNLHHQEDL